jgi:anaerobic selenocysteine-containing dehydrogenase
MPENDQLKMPAAPFGKKGSRRDFLQNPAVTALAGSALAACSIDKSEAHSAKAADVDHNGVPWLQTPRFSRTPSRITGCGMVTALIVT